MTSPDPWIKIFKRVYAYVLAEHAYDSTSSEYLGTAIRLALVSKRLYPCLPDHLTTAVIIKRGISGRCIPGDGPCKHSTKWWTNLHLAMLSPNINRFLSCHIVVPEDCKGRQRIGEAMAHLGFGRHSLKQIRWIQFSGDGIATVGHNQDHLQNVADMHNNLAAFSRHLPNINHIRYRRDLEGITEASRSYLYLAGKARLVQETNALYLSQLAEFEGFLPMLEVCRHRSIDNLAVLRICANYLEVCQGQPPFRTDKLKILDIYNIKDKIPLKFFAEEGKFEISFPKLERMSFHFLPGPFNPVHRDIWPYTLQFPVLWHLFVRNSTRSYYDLFTLFHGQPLSILDIHEPIEGFVNIDPKIIRHAKAFSLRSLTNGAPRDARYPEDTMKKFYLVGSVARLVFMAGVPVPFPVSLPWPNMEHLRITAERASPMKIAILVRKLPVLRKLDVHCQSMDPDNFDSNFWIPSEAAMRIYQYTGVPSRSSLALANSDPEILDSLKDSRVSELRINMAGTFNGNAVSAIVSRLPLLRTLAIHPRAVPVFENYFAIRKSRVKVIPYVINPLLPP